MKKQFIPHGVAIIIFLLLSCIYFKPVFEGKVLSQHDTSAFKGMSKETVDHREEMGEEPLWSNSMFGGMPTYLTSTLYPGNLTKKIKHVVSLGTPRPISFLFVSAICFYILLLVLGISPRSSIVGALAFSLSSYMVIIIGAGHLTKADAIAFAPLIFAGTILAVNRGKLLFGGSLLAIALALQLACNHLQITYYNFLMILIYGVVELIYAVKESRVKEVTKRIAILSLFAIVGVATNAGQLLTTYEYGNYSIRGKSDLTSDLENKTSGLDRDYATSWSYGKVETLTLLIPNLYGGSSQGAVEKNSSLHKALKRNSITSPQILKKFPLYWGAQPGTSGPVYVGAIVCFLFILGLFLMKGPLKWWLLSATILSIILSWGKNFMWLTDLFFDYMPGYNKFRAVSMTLVISQITMPLLAALTLHNIFKERPTFSDLKKPLIKAFALTGGVALLIAAVPSIIGDFTSSSDSYLPEVIRPAVHQYRSELLSGDALRSALFIVAATIIIYLFTKSKIGANISLAAIAILVVTDQYPVAKRYLNDDNFTTQKSLDSTFEPSIADRAILQDSDPYYRVLNLSTSTFNDATTSYFHKSIGGYHGAKMRRYQELIDYSLTKEFSIFSKGLQSIKSDEDIPAIFAQMNSVNMLNTKYVIYSPEAAPLVNSMAYGNAWFSNKVAIVDSADEEILKTTLLKTREESVINSADESYIKGASNSPITKDEVIELTSYLPNRLEYRSHSNSDRLAIFSDIFYDKGWEAHIDGERVDIARANFILRAVKVPAGDHKIEFTFSPASYKIGNIISLIASLLILVVVGFAFYRERRSKRL